MTIARLTWLAAASLALLYAHAMPGLAEGLDIYRATLMETGAKTAEVSTLEMQTLIAREDAIIIDARPPAEFVAGHIPGARVIDAPPSEQTATVDKIAKVIRLRWSSFTAMDPIVRPADGLQTNWSQ